jgi:hypothetical protein
VNVFCYYLIELQMGFTLWQWYYNKTQLTNTHFTQNSTLRSNKTQQTELQREQGHITYNEYNAKKSKAISVTGRGDL